MPISDTIERLATLQGIDEEVRALSDELEQLPKNLEAAREDQRAVEEKLNQAEAALEDIMKKRRSLEQEIQATEQNVIKYENDKLKVKTNVEFRAINNQIEGEKEKKSLIEDDVLLSYDEEESCTGLVAKLREELALVVKTVGERETDLKIRAEDDKKRLEQLKQQREGLLQDLDPKILSKYESIRKRKGSSAVVPIMRGACGGCHTQQPPQKVNEIRKKNALHLCEFCGRFLVWSGIEETAAS